MIFKASSVIMVLAFCFCTSNSIAQNKIIDSIIVVLKTAIEDTNKVITLNNLAWEYRQIGNNEQGIQYTKDALLLAKQLNYKKGEAKAYGNLGLMLNDLGRNSEAMQKHRLALKLRVDIGDWQGVGNSYTNIGHIHYDWSNYDSAVYYYLKTLKIREEMKDEYGIANCYNNLGNVNKVKGNYTDALKFQLDALKVRKDIGDVYGLADSYGNIGGIYQAQSNFSDALESYKKSLTLAESLNYKRTMIIALNNMGNVYSQQGNLPAALNNHFESLKINNQIGNKRGIGMSNDNIGIIYEKQENFLEAIKYFQIGLNIYKELGDKDGQVYNYTNIGNIYFGEANALLKKYPMNDLIKIKFNSAIEYYNNALKISQEIGNKHGIVMSFFNLGLVLRKNGKYSESLKNYKLALKISEEIGEKYGIAKSYIGIADLLVDSAKTKNQLQNYKEALTNVKKGLAVAIQIEAKEQIKSGYESLVEIYKGLKEYKQAMYYSTLYTNLKDSLFNNETKRKLESVRIQYEVEKATTYENAKQEKQKAEMKLAFDQREDSIKFQQKITSLQLTQQTYLTRQQEQDLILKQASLNLAIKQNELNRLNYLKSQTELEAEQLKREEKEKALTIANQEKLLQSSQLSLQQTQLNLKESQIQAEKKQRLFYIGGIGLLLLLFAFIYRSTQNHQRADRLIAAERLKSEKADAGHKMAELELQSLRAQLNPHFMFNSLNAIQELILKEDNDNSHLYLSRFSELLRSLLDNANQPFVSLKKEINLLELYLSLENLRVPDLKYTIEIDPAIDSNRVAIPNMMLQPYIENAIWHGLSHKKEEKNITVRISKKENGIVCEIEDNGVGRKMASELKSLYRKEHRSIGMELLSKRFNLLSREYGSDILTTIEDLHDNGTATGTRVSIKVPYSLTKQPEPAYS